MLSKEQAANALEYLTKSDGWRELLLPRARESAESAMADLLYKEDNDSADLAFTKGFIRGILLVTQDIPELIRQELTAE